MKTTIRNNQQLQKLVDADQHERRPGHYIGNELKVSRNDEKRRKKVQKMLTQKGVLTGRDFYNAALIYQHGPDIRDTKFAQLYSKKAMDIGYEPAKWLYAAATDRYLVRSGKKQKFGTQYKVIITNTRNGKQKRKSVLAPYDKRTTDKTRATLNVPTLKELIEQERVFTKMYAV